VRPDREHIPQRPVPPPSLALNNTIARAGSMRVSCLTTQTGVMSSDVKAAVATELATFHSDYTRGPRNWAHAVFPDYPPGSGLAAGNVSPTTVLRPLIRTDRIRHYGRGLLKRLWPLFQNATGAPDNQILIDIQEGPASHGDGADHAGGRWPATRRRASSRSALATCLVPRRFAAQRGHCSRYRVCTQTSCQLRTVGGISPCVHQPITRGHTLPAKCAPPRRLRPI